MDIRRLYQILDKTTDEFRKGEAVVEREAKGIHVTEVFAMPHESKAPVELVKVDCHFIVVGVDKKEAEKHSDELKQLLAEYPEPDRLAKGPSYIELGAVVESQDYALRLFALGQALGLWKVITPQTLGITGPDADQLAGQGFVMIEGYRTAVPV